MSRFFLEVEGKGPIGRLIRKALNIGIVGVLSFVIIFGARWALELRWF